MPAAQTGRRIPVIATAGILAGVVGLGLIGWASWGFIGDLLPGSEAPPYHYEPVASPPATPPHTELTVPTDVPVDMYRVVSADGNTIATAQVAESPELGRVLLEWKGTGDPTITQTASLRESLALSKAMQEHVPDDASVLAWWDISRQLQTLSGLDTTFNQHLGTPLFVPKAWQDSQNAVLSVEAEFWKDALDREAPDTEAATSGAFPAFVDALAAAPEDGAAALAKLTDGKTSYLVVHLVDALKIGLLRPDVLPIRYRDFPRTEGDVHGLIRVVKSWVEAQGLDAYAVHPLSKNEVRVYALPKQAATETLIGRLLPFSTSNSLKVKGLTLVYQVGGYWVYQLGGSGPGNEGQATADQTTKPRA